MAQKRGILVQAHHSHRHSALVRAMCAAISYPAFCSVHAEVVGMFPVFSAAVPMAARVGAGDMRRMDLVCLGSDFAAMCDPTIPNVTPDTLREFMVVGDLPVESAVEAVEKVKLRYYGPDLPSGWTFYPAGRGTMTESGPGARLFSHAVATEQARTLNGGDQPSSRLVATCLKWFEERTGCAIICALADDVLRAIKKSPHAALTEANKWRDPRYFAGHGRAGGGLVSLARGGGQDAHGAHTHAR